MERRGVAAGSAMSARRRHVFMEKVLKKLFPDVPSGQEKGIPRTLTSETPEKVTSEEVKHRHAHCLTDGGIKTQPEQRLYTVSLPPEGYVPCSPEPSSCTGAENASSDDAEDLDLHDKPKRRIRKHKAKKKIKNLNNDPVEQAKLEKQWSLLQEKLQPQLAGGPTMSKNKKRKLKKKEQIRKKKAAGVVRKASGVSFTYQPEEGSFGLGGSWSTAGEAEGLPGEEDTGTDATQEDAEITNKKADGILNFLKSTQEIYFYDGVAEDSDSAICMETTEELFRCLESHSVPPSDVFLLDHMKTLLLLRDTERLKGALEVFVDHCMMPPDHARVISAFFNYWITHVLPEKNSD